MKAQIQPYLFFGGHCEEALEFYCSALGAEVDMLMRYRDSPEPVPAGSVPAGFDDKIMHATFHIGGTTLMASDGDEIGLQFTGFALSLSVPTDADAGRVFNALADRGQVRMPLGKTFWSPCFGMVTDRFGIGWMISAAPDDDV